MLNEGCEKVRVNNGWLSLIGLVILASGAFAAQPAAEWPQWRGPNRDDISTETGLLKQWPTGGPQQVWKATGLGAGFSGPAIAGGKIFTMGDAGASCNLFALDVTNGKQLWKAEVGKAGAFNGIGGPRSTPTVDKDLVFALGQYGDLVCVQAATGQPVWQKNLVSDFGGKVPDWGCSESPLVDGNLVMCSPGGEQGLIVALNKSTGALVWRSRDLKDKPHYSSIIVEEIGGVRQYIQTGYESVAGVAAKDGQLLWRGLLPLNPAAGRVTTPIYADNEIFTTCGYGFDGTNAFKITVAGGQFKAEKIYKIKELTNHHGGVVLVGQHLYGHSNMTDAWNCLEFKTGKVAWANKGIGRGSLTCADGRLYLRSADNAGTVALVEATPDAYKEISRFDQPDRSKKNTWTHPVVCGGKLYLRDQDILLCFNVKAP